MARSRVLSLIVSVVCLFMLSWSLPEAAAAGSLEEGVQSIADELAKRMEAQQVKKIAVVEFTDLNGYRSALGQFLAEELITAFLTGQQAVAFSVVERRELSRVLEEQQLSESSLFDEESIARIGKVLGIDALVTGTISDLSTEVRVNARAIAVETARIFAATATTVPKDDRVKELMRRSAGGSASLPQPPQRQIQRNDVLFRSELLQVEVASIGRSEDGTQVTLSLVFRNLSKEDLFLALAFANFQCAARLVDDRGMTVGGAQGRVSVTGLPCLHYDPNIREGSNYSRFSPGADTPVVFSFEAQRGETFKGSVYSFSALLLQHLGEEDSGRLTVGIANVELPE